MKKRTKQILLPRLTYKAPFDGLGQVFCIVRDKVGQLAVFAVVPDLLVGIQFRSVRRKPLHINSAAKPSLQLPCPAAMDHPPVNHKNDSAWKMFQQIGHKIYKIRRTNSVAFNRKIQPQTAAFRRAGYGRNHRQPIPAIPTAQNGRLPFGSPCPPNSGLQHKPAFVQKNEGFTRSAGFFLYAAKFSHASRRWPLHPVRGPAFRVFGNSSPSAGEDARHWTGRRLSRNAFGSLQRSAAGSTVQSDSRSDVLPSAAAFSTAQSVCQTDSTSVPADCGPRKTPRLAVHRPHAIDLWLRALRQRDERSRLRDVPAGAKQSPCVAYPIIGQGFLWVSYPCYRQKHARLFNFSKINKRRLIDLCYHSAEYHSQTTSVSKPDAE